jgi:hypothetical protein
MTTVTPVPVLPSKLTPATVVAYVASLATFVLGVLTSAGVTVPSGVATDVQAVAGAVVTVVGVVTALVATLSQHSVEKAQIAAGK